MTLVAVFRPERPIIVSDVLLSHLGLPAVRFTPTGVEIKPTNPPGRYRPYGFSQKTVLLHDDRVAFTGTGKVQTLKSLATDLAARIRRGMERGALESWLREKEVICGDSTSAIVCWFDHDGFVSAKVGGGIHVLPLLGDGTVVCGGSGVDWLKRNLIRKFSSIETVGEFDEHETVRALAIAQTGQHLVQERMMGIRDDFGGGFQTTYFDGQQFVPVRDSAFITFLVEHDETGPLDMELAPPIVMQRWSGRRLSFELWSLDNVAFGRSGGKALLRAGSRFNEAVVPPLLHSRMAVPPARDLDIGEYVNAQVLHHREGKLIGLGCFQLMGDSRLNPIRISGKRDEQVEVELSEALFEDWRVRFTPRGKRQ